MAEDDKPGPLKRAMSKVGIGDEAEGEQRTNASGDEEARQDSGQQADQETKAQGSDDGEKDGQSPQSQGSDDTGERDGDDDGPQAEGSDDDGPQAEGSDDTGDDGEGSEGSDDGEKSEEERAQETMRELEKDPPEDLTDWPGPGDKAMYQTFAINEEGWKGTTLDKLGPSSLRRFEDGSVTVEGEKVDNPDDYKGDPIPGGPTDPNTPEDE